MKLYITEQVALKRYPTLKKKELEKILNDAGANTVQVLCDDDQEKVLAIYDDDLAAYVAERDITPEKFNELRGNLLGLSEAGMKYNVNPRTVARWASQGTLEVKGTDGQKKLIDEADVAYLAALGRAKKMRPGKKPFSQ